MARPDIIVVAASARGVEALSRLAADLPEDLAAAVFVVLHVSASSPSVLPAILNRRGPLPARHAEDGEPIKNGRIYVARPDHHLLVSPGTVRLGRGPREHGLRPAADTLFLSAAAAYGPRVVGVVLSGTLDDGTAGLVAIKARGGVAVVQDPDDALFPGMPRSALGQDHPDLILPLAEIGSALVKLTKRFPDPDKPSGFRPEEPSGSGQEEAGMSDEIDAELSWSVPNLEVAPTLEPPFGSPSGYTCPECSGALWEIVDGDLVRFRCRVGHGYGADSLDAEQARALEAALWTAVRALEERAALSTRMADRARQQRHPHTAARFQNRAVEAERRANEVRAVLRATQAIGGVIEGSIDEADAGPSPVAGES